MKESRKWVNGIFLFSQNSYFLIQNLHNSYSKKQSMSMEKMLRYNFDTKTEFTVLWIV